MKKIICILLLLVCMTSFAVADSFDLSALSFDELMDLRIRLNSEIVSRPEWKEVTVPSGTWTVGKDIPAGEYSLLPGDEGGYIRLKRGGKNIVSQGIRDQNDVYGKIELQDGDIVQIERGSIIFAPPIGLGF